MFAYSDRPFTLRIIILTVLLTSVTGHTQEELARWEFLAGEAAPSHVAAGIKAGSVTDPKTERSDGLLPDYIGISPRGQAYYDAHFLRPQFDGVEGAVAGEQYIEFEVAPADKNSLSLLSLAIECGGNTIAGETFQASLAVTSSADGHKTLLGERQFEIFQSIDHGDWKPSEEFKLVLGSEPALQKIREPVTFRIYARVEPTQPGPWNVRHVRIDSISLTGESRP
jgi:hypothetical protein